jgi:hypothetical protein
MTGREEGGEKESSGEIRELDEGWKVGMSERRGDKVGITS